MNLGLEQMLLPTVSLTGMTLTRQQLRGIEDELLRGIEEELTQLFSREPAASGKRPKSLIVDAI